MALLQALLMIRISTATFQMSLRQGQRHKRIVAQDHDLGGACLGAAQLPRHFKGGINLHAIDRDNDIASSKPAPFRRRP